MLRSRPASKYSTHSTVLNALRPALSAMLFLQPTDFNTPTVLTALTTSKPELRDGLGSNFMKRIAIVGFISAVIIFAAITYSEAQDLLKAIAVLSPTQNSKVTGIVTFTKVPEGIKVVADIKGLTPGSHGFHIHQFGDCSAPNADSAGGHYNPMGKPHGAPHMGERHMGDLGNIVADASGTANLQKTDSVLSVTGVNSIVGHAVIVHEKADDFKTQPTGDAGGRLACGVIGIASIPQ